MRKGATVTAYKAFDQNWSCRDFRYEIGHTYEHKGKVSICSSGFHACAVPFDCWNYYPHSMNLARVTLDGVSDQRDGDSKLCAAKITIEASLSIPEWIKAQVETVLNLCKSAKGKLAGDEKESAAATGYRGHAAATGDSGHAAATGYRGHAAATGDSGHAAATGDSGHAAATGDSGHAAATGDRGHAAATGDSGHAAVKGKNAIAASLGIDGRAQADEGGFIILAHWKIGDDGLWALQGLHSAKVGENGIKAGVAYGLGEAGEFVEMPQ